MSNKTYCSYNLSNAAINLFNEFNLIEFIVKRFNFTEFSNNEFIDPNAKFGEHLDFEGFLINLGISYERNWEAGRGFQGGFCHYYVYEDGSCNVYERLKDNDDKFVTELQDLVQLGDNKKISQYINSNIEKRTSTLPREYTIYPNIILHGTLANIGQNVVSIKKFEPLVEWAIKNGADIYWADPISGNSTMTLLDQKKIKELISKYESF